MADKSPETPLAREKLQGRVTTSHPKTPSLGNDAHTKINPRYTKAMPTSNKFATAQIKSADMTDDMQQESIEVAQEAMAKFTVEKDIAQHIKRTFDERKGPTWHCIVGRNFGSFVTHETKHFIYFYLGHCAILLFKTQ
ncbi:dynein light chain [Cordyceps fumosorosea ARSEF 2679]|uniref:Dynein light chain n=1 Tax=Cordyceps fumosorosea (strain ARSEF 2679) TaxID=1081104 RepID=A0A167J1Y3_CORFA|nr:dynein light chain [Cordyceps fumosorosea ARSEF 2679]OAA49705.1 dynein light chain [Cordyceps fumosorosea ARSEF 2679]